MCLGSSGSTDRLARTLPRLSTISRARPRITVCTSVVAAVLGRGRTILIREEPRVHRGEENEKSFGLHGRPLPGRGRLSRMPVRRGPLEPGSGSAPPAATDGVVVLGSRVWGLALSGTLLIQSGDPRIRSSDKSLSNREFATS